MYLPLLLVIVVAYVVNARDCLSPSVMNNFDMNKFQGDWYEMAYKTSNKTDEDEYTDTSCVFLGFTPNGDHYNVKVNYIYEEKSQHDIGKFTPEDTTKPIFHMNFPQEPDYKNYVYKVLCTDHDTYAVVYSSQQYEAGHCSEFEIVMVKDRSKYGDIVKSDNVKNCFKDKLHTSIDQLKPIPQNSCQNS